MLLEDPEAAFEYYRERERMKQGIFSTLAPSNRLAWSRLDFNEGHPAGIKLKSQLISRHDQQSWQAMRELLVDPQTCGPLALACSKDCARHLCELGPWKRIGTIHQSDH